MTTTGAQHAAAHGLHMLLGRVEYRGGSPVPNQTHTASIYRAAMHAQGRAAYITTAHGVPGG